MLKVLFHSLTGGFKIATLIVSIILTNLYGCKSTQLSKIQGEDAHLIFPYPCDSTEVTLRHSYRVPFYHLTDRSTLSLPEDQVHRFKVQNRIENENCSLDLTISNILSIDQGTYFSTVYKDGQLRDDYTTRVGMRIEYPPGKASCVVSKEMGGDWVSIDCTANVGSLLGKIECYQGGVWMPPLTDPTETHTSLKYTILIRKSWPAFCCSTLDEYKSRCECNDTGLYIADDDSNDPCPPLSETTTVPLLSTLTENNQSDYYSTMTSFIPINMNKWNCKKCVNVMSILFLTVVILQILSLFVHYKIATRNRNNKKTGKDPPNPPQLNVHYLNVWSDGEE